MAEKRGTDGKDELSGTDDADDLFGYKGKDEILGGAGDDFIVGHEGKDQLTGGSGADEFVFARKSDLKDANVDTIRDFDPREDVILLDYNVFKHMRFGTLDEEYFHVGKKAKTADHHIIFNPKNATLYYDKDGKGGAEQKPFVKVPFLAEPPQSVVIVLSAFAESDLGLPL